MSAEAAVLLRMWSVGKYTVTLTLPKPRRGERVCASIEWAPSMPTGRLTDAELQQYIAGRNAAISELSEALGLRFLVIDI